MSIKNLDKKLEITTDEKGIVSFRHPDATTVITSDYKVYNADNGRELRVYQNDHLIGGQISSRFKGKRSNYSFGRLLALMAGQPIDGYYRIKDGSKPLSLDNITTLKDHMYNPNKNIKPVKKESEASSSIVEINHDYKRQDVQKPAFKSVSEKDNGKYDFSVSIDKSVIDPYVLEFVPCTDNVNYVTEDGLLFVDDSKALIHQLNVDKGKELASIVLADKGGYVLAEKMYLSQVNYHDGKPIDYNFKTILENNEGIKEIGDKTYLIEKDDSGTQQFRDKETMEKWLKARALIDLIIDHHYDPDKIAKLLN